MTDEIWKTVPGFSDYEVSSHGRIRSYRRKKDGQPLSAKASAKNWYCIVSLINDSGERKNIGLHRLVAMCFLNDFGPAKMVLHKDGNRTNNHVSNLYIGMHKENAADAIKHGAMARGSRHGCATINEDQARQIKERLAKGDSHPSIAKALDVSVDIVHNISKGRNWTHV